MILRRLAGLSGRIVRTPAAPADTPEDPWFFSSMFTESADGDSTAVVEWQSRRQEIQARPIDRDQGIELLARHCSGTLPAALLAPQDLASLAGYMDLVQVDAGQAVIRQGEPGGFVLLVLHGWLAIDRQHQHGGHTRVAQAGPGDLLGEMSFLGGGDRVATCTTLAATSLAVMERVGLDDLARQEPRLASLFMAFMAQRLSLRLRHASAHLCARMSRAPGPEMDSL